MSNTSDTCLTLYASLLSFPLHHSILAALLAQVSGYDILSTSGATKTDAARRCARDNNKLLASYAAPQPHRLAGVPL
eukprot:14899259-Heterocapsa_arctica.AAC.1